MWSGEISGSVHRDYNNDFNIISRNVNGSHTVSFDYDDDGLLSQAGDLALGRDPQNGLITGTTLGTVTTAQGYNGFGELGGFAATHSGTPLYETAYTRDNLGRITQMEETILGTSKIYTYGYDDAGRLEDVWEGLVNISHYEYDFNGNRLRHVTPEGTNEGTYDDQDRMLTYNDATYTYTDNGELWTKTVGTEVKTYTYDVLGNLLSVDLPDGNRIDYVIDGLNRRIGKKVNGTLVQGFLYKDALNPIAELDGGGNVVGRFVYGGKFNVPDYMVKGGVTYRIISDHLGSPRLVVNVDTGDVVQEMKYDEFGNVTVDTNPGFQPFGFAGGIYDLDTGLVRFGARDYDAETGRWTAKDPILFFVHDTNIYGYQASDPINWIDPIGLDRHWMNPKFPLPQIDLASLSRMLQKALSYVGYADFNVTGAPLPVGVGPTAGVMMSTEGSYPYVGVGVATGPGGAITCAPVGNRPTPGVNVGVQAGYYGVGGQFGYSFEDDALYWEGGTVTHGASLTIFYVKEPDSW